MEIIEQFIELEGSGLISREEVDTAIEGYFLSLRRPSLPRPLFQEKFNLELMTDEEVVMQFRFHREDLPLLQRCLEIPNEVYLRERRYRVPGLKALCILLRRLSYPNRLCDLKHFFGMSASALSSVAQFLVNHIVERKGHLLSQLDSHRWLDRDKLAYYAEAVQRKGAPLQNCWGFIDGTARHICRPHRSTGVDQEEYYSGHKRYHCIKFQSTVTPDGLIISLLGSFSGRRHDAGIFRETQFIEQLRRLCEGQPQTYVLYGDAAYSISDVLLKPFPSTTTDENEERFNHEMSVVRQAVEWQFGKVVREFAFVDFHKNYKLMKQDVTGIYQVACILTNAHTCLYGSQVSEYFQTQPPSLEQYLV